MHKNIKALALNKVCCRYHPDAYLFEDRVCSKCGLEVEQIHIDYSAEWRTFADDSKNAEKSRVGAAENYLLGDEHNLSTSIQSGSNCNAYGTSILKQFARRSTDKALTTAYRRIDVMGDRINLPECVTTHAKYLYQLQLKERQLKGNILSSDAKVAACLYIACHEQGVPRTIKEVTAIAEEGRKEIRQAANMIIKVLKRDMKPIDSKDLLPRFCGKLFLPHSITKEASQILSSVRENAALKNVFPESAAAASIYLAALNTTTDHLTQQTISEQVGITAATISRIHSLMNSYLTK